MNEYLLKRSGYQGHPYNDSYAFDAELVENVISKLKRGKAAGLDNLTCEHLLFSHALLPCILAKLFNMMIKVGHVPPSFGQSYTVPILKSGCSVYGKTITVEDFRGVSISPVISKVLEHCILDRYGTFLGSSDNQFGFKKSSGCAHAVHVLRSVVDYYVSFGSTVNICALDLSKAFDKMNHCGLFIKLMERHIPVYLLSLLEHWFSIGVTCVKWGSRMSSFFGLSCGIRQGGVLSPYLFAIYIDSVIRKVSDSRFSSFLKGICISILLYADDILLVAPSVTSLQQLLLVCEQELMWLDMSLNVKKSSCIRIGARYTANCCNIVNSEGRELLWVHEVRYLGIFIEAASSFKCSLENAKRSFYRSFNSIFGRVGRVASNEVIIQLLKSKCLPILYYGMELCPLRKSQFKSLDFVINSAMRKIFDTKSQDIVDACRDIFNCLPAESVIANRRYKFLRKISVSENKLCCLFAANAVKELLEIRQR